MRHAALVLALTAATIGGSAQALTTNQKPVTVVVTTPDRNFAPQLIRMPGNRPVRLVLRNPSDKDHDFHAPVFFAKARIEAADSRKVWDGEVQVPKHSAIAVRFIPMPGHYEVTSTKPLDMATGMKGEILVF